MGAKWRKRKGHHGRVQAGEQGPKGFVASHG